MTHGSKDFTLTRDSNTVSTKIKVVHVVY